MPAPGFRHNGPGPCSCAESAAGDQAAQLQRGQEHGAGLAAMDRFQRFEPAVGELAGQVIGLTADQLRGSGGAGQHAATALGRDRRGLNVLGQHFEGQRQQGVARQDGRASPNAL